MLSWLRRKQNERVHLASAHEMAMADWTPIFQHGLEFFSCGVPRRDRRGGSLLTASAEPQSYLYCCRETSTRFRPRSCYDWHRGLYCIVTFAAFECQVDTHMVQLGIWNDQMISGENLKCMQCGHNWMTSFQLTSIILLFPENAWHCYVVNRIEIV